MIANIAHMVVVKKDYFPQLKKPLNDKMFGANKTYRGFICLMLFNLIATAGYLWFENSFIQGDNAWNSVSHPYLIAIGIGLIYGLGELPNSFIKRRLGVKPGKTSDKYKLVFIIYDHIDSNLPAYLFFGVFSSLTLVQTLAFSACTFMMHFIINYILYLLGIRKNAL